MFKGRHEILKGVIGCSFTAVAYSPASNAQCFDLPQIAKLAASPMAAETNYGNSVAMDDGWLFVGAFRTNVALTDCGAGYFYEYSGGSFGTQIRVLASDRATGDELGTSVAMSGVWAAAGAARDTHLSIQSGSVYAYMQSGSTWGVLSGTNRVENQKLNAAVRANHDRFGCSVDIDGSTMVIGADEWFKPGGVGKAYVFEFESGAWVEKAVLTAPFAQLNDKFGTSVAISGDTIIIGAPRVVGFPGLGDVGSAHIFERDGNGDWIHIDQLFASDGASGDTFGRDVSLDGDVAVCGAEQHDGSIGAAYVFRRSGGLWIEEAKLTPDSPAPAQQFGNAVSVEAGLIAVGSFNDASSSGSVYVYNNPGANWALAIKQFAPDFPLGDQFSRDSLAFSDGAELVVGAQADEPVGAPAGNNHGSAYVLDVSCAQVVSADTDNDGLSDADEAIHGTNPNDPDTDDDDLLDGIEVELQIMCSCSCPSPLDPDSDDDGLSDSQENNFGPNTCNPDVDNDGLLDGDEVLAGTDFTDPDSDDDGVNDGPEVNTYGSNPLSNDTDGDGLQDGMEVAFTTNLLDPDSDDDGLTDGDEVDAAAGGNCPSPTNADSDDDDLDDGVESSFGTGICNADSDGDGLSDGSENAIGTSPTNPDSDADDLLDGLEVSLAAGSGCPDPLNADSDLDGLSDGNELTGGSGPCDSDSDNDGLSDGNEAIHGTDVLDEDSDNDGMLDGAEVDVASGGGCPNPLDPDSDDDTLSDGGEIAIGASPCNIDTDGDGIGDAIDPFPTTPGIPANWVANMTQATAGGILTLPTAEFLGPNNNIKVARRTILAAEVLLASILIDNGNYNAAKALLTIVERRVDDLSAPPDWMTAGNAKSCLHSDVETLIILVDFLN